MTYVHHKYQLLFKTRTQRAKHNLGSETVAYLVLNTGGALTRVSQLSRQNPTPARFSVQPIATREKPPA